MHESSVNSKKRLEAEIEDLHTIINYWKKEYEEVKASTNSIGNV